MGNIWPTQFSLVDIFFFNWNPARKTQINTQCGPRTKIIGHLDLRVSNSTLLEGQISKKKCLAGRNLQEKHQNKLNLIKFQNFETFAGRTSASGGPYAALGPRVWDPCPRPWNPSTWRECLKHSREKKRKLPDITSIRWRKMQSQIDWRN